MKLFRPCFFLKWFYPGAIFRIDTEEKTLYLTFDDGPNPGSTELLIGILGKFGIKGLFFCSGREAEKYPDLIRKLKDCGHLIGNHGYNHYDGWMTSREKYKDDIKKASEFIDSRLFRPPYGHLKLSQYRQIVKEYSVFFWDLMPFDFDKNFSRERLMNVLKKKIRPGSVIVFHDTPTAISVELLFEFFNYALDQGYRFGLPGWKI
jgi:peptidoglycan/xylan/chitin deacetylase (PgdA/CDA1 family)